MALHEKLASLEHELKELQDLREREQQELRGLKGVITSLQQSEDARRLTATPSAVEDLQGLHRAIVIDMKMSHNIFLSFLFSSPSSENTFLPLKPG